MKSVHLPVFVLAATLTLSAVAAEIVTVTLVGGGRGSLR